MRIARWTALAALTALALAACAPATSSGGSSPSGTGLATVKQGVLTFATSDPAYAPWVQDNDPSSGKGFESAVAYAVADKLGYPKDKVVWVNATFDQIIAPGVKNFDVAINQVSITDERKANLDFSSPYYTTTQAVVTLASSPAAKATTLADLAPLRIGAMVGTTSLTAAQKAIKPTTAISVYNSNDDAKAALTSNLVDAIVVDLPTALYITSAELDGGVILGQLPDSAGGDQFGLVLDKGSALTAPVSAAVDALAADGTLDTLQSTWLTDAAGAPVLK
ncbi:ABC transporter substrate-binding protein [Cellulomonas citrea]|uniref:ABC transporter substrate-binding protein n=1 Tax=Cellulomonas citrea TaxID=1909423 RepID=UPI00135AAA5A|nr:transporter substrate-binding domain-containing protein [Cellulomonas citrea]